MQLAYHSAAIAQVHLVQWAMKFCEAGLAGAMMTGTAQSSTASHPPIERGSANTDGIVAEAS